MTPPVAGTHDDEPSSLQKLQESPGTQVSSPQTTPSGPVGGGTSGTDPVGPVLDESAISALVVDVPPTVEPNELAPPVSAPPVDVPAALGLVSSELQPGPVTISVKTPRRANTERMTRP
jgi:hypothetical protein